MSNSRNASAKAGPQDGGSPAGGEISLAWQTGGQEAWRHRPRAAAPKAPRARRLWLVCAALGAICLAAAVLWRLGDAATGRETAAAIAAPDEPMAAPALSAARTVAAVSASDTDLRSPLSVIGLGSQQPGAAASAGTGPAATPPLTRAEPAPFPAAAPGSGPDVPAGGPAPGDDGSGRARPAQAGGPGGKRAPGARPADGQSGGSRNSQWTATFFGN